MVPPSMVTPFSFSVSPLVDLEGAAGVAVGERRSGHRDIVQRQRRAALDVTAPLFRGALVVTGGDPAVMTLIELSPVTSMVP